LYARVPAIPDCDGRCWISCGPADRSQREDQRIRAAGIRITPADEAGAQPGRYYCEALTAGKQCAVYDIRPMSCRLWGATEGMKCPYGCVPEGGWLTDQEGLELITEAMRAGGSHLSGVPRADLDVAMASEFVRQSAEVVRAQGRAGIRERASETIPAAFRRR
jgi:Fe-S-cluster containining protein